MQDRLGEGSYSLYKYIAVLCCCCCALCVPYVTPPSESESVFLGLLYIYFVCFKCMLWMDEWMDGWIVLFMFLL